MKQPCLKILLLALMGAAGCATPSRVTLLPGVGPTPSATAQNTTEGFLQVYSARERVPTNINGEEFVWNNDYGRNDFLYASAHTGYSLYRSDGQLLQQVPNATGMNDAQPTLLKLSPGAYQVKASAEDFNGVDATVMVPVCVEPGLTTVVHLDDQLNARTTGVESQWVRLANGSIVGWHCSGSEKASVALQASN